MTAHTPAAAEQRHTPGPLTALPTGLPRQFQISRGEGRCPPDMEWDDYYVDFSGYFGSHGPHMFAAAPDILTALRRCLNFIENTESEMGETLPCGDEARAAIAKATGAAA